jgi:acetate kinase
VAIDASQNASARGETEISAEAASVATLVIPAREDLEIARQVRALLSP